MKKLVLGFGLLAAAATPALADGLPYGWSYFPAVPPSSLKWPGYAPRPGVQPKNPSSGWQPILGTAAIPPVQTRRIPIIPGPMKVIMVRSNAQDCGDHCAEWISAEGEIQTGTPALFRKVLAALGPRKLPVLITSQGGKVMESLAIGRLIRARGLDVIVSRTQFPPCGTGDTACSREGAPRNGAPTSSLAYCASACVNILAAGAQRIVPPHDAFVGVHDATQMKLWRMVEKIPVRNPFGQFTGYRVKISDSSGWKEPAGPGLYKTLASYFKSMGIAGDIVNIMHAASSDTIHWLSEEELDATGLATKRLTSEDYIGAIDHPKETPVSPASSPDPAPSMASTVPPAATPPPAPAQSGQAASAVVQSGAPAPAQTPLPVHAVQTEVTHIAVGSLPPLKGPADDDVVLFATPQASALASSQQHATADLPPPAAKSAPASSPTRLASVATPTSPVAGPARHKAAASTPAQRDRSMDAPVQTCGSSIRTVPAAGMRLTGEVRAVMPPAAASMILQRAEDTIHVRANPKYFSYQRLGVWIYNGGSPQPGTAVAPHGMNIQPGDTVTIVTRHQDGALPCHFVPNLVVAVRRK